MDKEHVLKVVNMAIDEHVLKVVNMAIEKLGYAGQWMNDDELLVAMIKTSGEVRGLLIDIRKEIENVSDNS